MKLDRDIFKCNCTTCKLGPCYLTCPRDSDLRPYVCPYLQNEDDDSHANFMRVLSPVATLADVLNTFHDYKKSEAFWERDYPDWFISTLLMNCENDSVISDSRASIERDSYMLEGAYSFSFRVDLNTPDETFNRSFKQWSKKEIALAFAQAFFNVGIFWTDLRIKNKERLEDAELVEIDC